MEAELERKPERELQEPLPTEQEAEAPKLVSTRSRCPYCHEEVRSERADWVACEGCLARHHASCWSERGSCACCHGRGVLVRKRSRRGVTLALLLLGLVAGVAGGVVASRRAFRGEIDRVEPVAARTASDEALLALGYFAQTTNRERFMDRMVAAAIRYDEKGKPEDAKLLREVASIAVAEGPNVALDSLKRRSMSGGAAPTTGTNEAELNRCRIEERKIAYEILGLDRLSNPLDRANSSTEFAKQLLDVARRYQAANSASDAKRVQDAADALVRGERADRRLAVKLLGFSTEHAPDPAETDDDAKPRAIVKAVVIEIKKILAANPDAKDFAAQVNELRTAQSLYAKLGLSRDETRLAKAIDDAEEGDGQAVVKRLEASPSSDQPRSAK